MRQRENPHPSASHKARPVNGEGWEEVTACATMSSGAENEVGARLEAHAPEYIVDPDTGQWYITTAGWPGEPFGTKIPGSVAIRELDWVE